MIDYKVNVLGFSLGVEVVVGFFVLWIVFFCLIGEVLLFIYYK